MKCFLRWASAISVCTLDFRSLRIVFEIANQDRLKIGLCAFRFRRACAVRQREGLGTRLYSSLKRRFVWHKIAMNFVELLANAFRVPPAVSPTKDAQKENTPKDRCKTDNAEYSTTLFSGTSLCRAPTPLQEYVVGYIFEYTLHWSDHFYRPME